MKSEKVSEYINHLKSTENLLNEADDDIFSGAIEKISVFDDTLEFKLKCYDKTIIYKRMDR